MFGHQFNRTRLRWWIWAALVVAPAAEGAAGSQSAAPFRLKSWTTEDGLPSNTIRSMMQARDDYLWVGTKLGLARFDGVRFRVFAGEWGVEREGDLSCQALMEDSEGRIWFTTPSMLVSYHQGRFEKFPCLSAPINGLIRSATASRFGGLWIGHNDRGLIRFENGKVIRAYRTEDGLAASSVELLKEDSQGRLWIRSSHPKLGIFWQRLDPRTDQFTPLSSVIGQSITNVLDLHEEQQGERLWLVTRPELLCWHNGNLEHVTNSGVWKREGYGDGTEPIGPIVSGPRGQLWLAPRETGKLVRFDGERFEPFGTADGLADPDIRTLLPDREGNLWVGFGGAALQRLRPRALHSLLTTNEAGGHQQVDSVCASATGAVWAGTWSGLLRWEAGSVRLIPNPNPVPSRGGSNAHPVWEDRTGRVWFGSEKNGLHTIERGDAVRVEVADMGRTNWLVRVLHEDRAGRLWIGAEDGLIEKRGDGFVRYSRQHGLLEGEILGIRDAPDGSLWIGTKQGGLQRLREGRFHTIAAPDGVFSHGANPLLVEDDGTVWVGTPHGLARVRGEGRIVVVTERQGLHDNEPFCLLSDDAGHYWANSVHGIFRVRKSDLHAVADGRQSRVYCVSYGESDGAASAEGNGEFQPNACRRPDGTMWFATTRGVTVLDPATLVASDLPPKVVVEDVLAEDRLIFADGSPTAEGSRLCRGGSEMRLPAGRGSVLEFRYTANTFVAPEKVRFRYRLEGVEPEWREPGTRRSAFYTNLRPGSYRFRVEAANQEGTWSAHPVEFSFSIAPKFTQTMWFPVSGAVGLLAVSGAIAGWRLRWQRRALRLEQAAALAADRARIAQDIHDDIGSSLTRIQLLSQVVEEVVAEPLKAAEAKAHSQSIATTAREVAQRMDEIVWAVDPEQDTLASFVDYICHAAQEVLQPAGIRCRLEVPIRPPDLRLASEKRHHLYLLVREALHNAWKHSGASAITLRVSCEAGSLRMTVEDDGCGFDPQQAGSHGHGLRNMRERAGRLGGNCAVETRTPGGTTVRFEIPLP